MKLRGLATTLAVTAATLLLPACRRAPDAAAPAVSATDELIAEAGRIAALFSPTRLLLLLVVLLGAIAISRVAQAAVAHLWRMGLDRRRRLAALRRALDILVIVGLLSLFANRVLAAAPVLGGVAALLVAVGGLWMFAQPLQNIAAGLAIVLRGRVHEGDHLVLGDVRGTVQEIGLTRLVLRDGQGSTVYVPCQVVERQVARVHRARPQVPVSLRYPLPPEGGPEALARLRERTLLSPWRVPGTRVSVVADPERQVVDVQFQSWTEAAAEQEQQKRAGV